MSEEYKIQNMHQVDRLYRMDVNWDVILAELVPFIDLLTSLPQCNEAAEHFFELLNHHIRIIISDFVCS